MFNQGTLVLEGVTLAELVEFVVEVLVNLAGSAILDQKTSENTQASHPENLAAIPILSAKVPLVHTSLVCP